MHVDPAQPAPPPLPVHAPRKPRLTLGADASAPAESIHPTDSFLGGAPWRPKGAGWPRGASGALLGFLAQLNLDQLSHWQHKQSLPTLIDGALPPTGLLQFFLPTVDGFGLEGPDRAAVFYLPTYSSDPSHAAELVRLTHGLEYPGETTILARPDQSLPLRPTRVEPTWQFINPITDDTVTDADREALTSWLDEPGDQSRWLEYARVERERYGNGETQVGGYPLFLQGDPRPRASREVLLLQLDGSSNALFIGDSGIMQFFIEPADLARRDFSRVRMHWASA